MYAFMYVLAIEDNCGNLSTIEDQKKSMSLSVDHKPPATLTAVGANLCI